MDNNDCPVCLEKMVEGNDNCAMSGINCSHTLCIPCYCKITESENKKCPICRADLTDESNNSYDSDDDEIENIFTGNNNRPTNDLFLGRRWFNTETNKIECYYFFFNENGVYNDWIDVDKKVFSIFIERYLNLHAVENNNHICCYVCGIQKTTEVNEFMKNKYPNGFIYNNDSWDDFFIDGYNNCYECHNMYCKLIEVFHN